MTWRLLARAPVALLPVLVFLADLVYFDSYRLGAPACGAVVSMAAGAVAAGVSYPLNGALLNLSVVSPSSRSMCQTCRPWLEELLKALILIHLLRTRRVSGLLVDAAIAGFAVGTVQFVLVEYLYYLAMRPEAQTDVQVIRGFGTAIMHGGATAIFGIVSVALVERKGDTTPRVFVPGWSRSRYRASFRRSASPARRIHCSRRWAILLALPPLIYFVFQHSERSLSRLARKMISTPTIDLLRVDRNG